MVNLNRFFFNLSQTMCPAIAWLSSSFVGLIKPLKSDSISEGFSKKSFISVSQGRYSGNIPVIFFNMVEHIYSNENAKHVVL